MNYLKISFISTLLLTVTFLSGQDDIDLSKRSEIKVNALYLILGGFELDYEYILNEESSFGVSVAAFFDDDVSYKWGITPHYRLFFGNRPALGFFVEGHASVFSYDDYNIIYNGNGSFTEMEDKRTYAGVGIAVGGKFKTSRDVVVEISAGLGRVFGNDNYLEAYPRIGINIGKRF